MSRLPGGPSPTTADVLSALEQAAVGEGVEHIRIHLSRAGARGVFFVVAADQEAARRVCAAVCTRACTESPLLQGWTNELLNP
ncbi:hypothetical protein [Peterkaempfera sp. SMS 1(5)a]|uniref:hypothetical protein n=1 Tax=Peterkaempfera podocarpi TaxID=3232308 RepID=UPI003671F897